MRTAKNRVIQILCSLFLCLALVGCSVEIGDSDSGTTIRLNTPTQQTETQNDEKPQQSTSDVQSVAEVPPYSGEPYVVLNDNEPNFSKEELVTKSYEEYGALDELGRCTVTMASIGVDLMPTEKRGDIGKVKPTGWVTARYDNVEGKYLYNRCHLIGFQLTAENANERNLITGTRYMNVEGMLPFENLVADYIKETQNHVLYRVTPIFEGNNLVASGVEMEAKSVEDDGEGVNYHVFVYNVQPGIEIDYATGESRAAAADANAGEEQHYILNTGTKKFHKPDCTSAKDTKPENKEEYIGTRDIIIKQGYVPCSRCNP